MSERKLADPKLMAVQPRCVKYDCREHKGPHLDRCYYHNKVMLGYFDPGIERAKRMRYFEKWLRMGGLNLKPFQGVDILCPIKAFSEVLKSEADLERNRFEELLKRIEARKLKLNAIAEIPS